MKIYILIIIITLFTMLLYSNTLVVKQDATGDYIVIQTAINNATSGDTIRVYPGIYYENLLIEKDLSVVSNYEYSNNENDIYNTIIDGNYSGSCIRFEGEENSIINNYICGFIIQNGKATDQNGETNDWGGGVYSYYSNINIKKNIIRNNTAKYGSGVQIYHSTALLSGNTIRNNNAYIIGGGVDVVLSTINFDQELLNNIYLNNAGKGTDIYKAYNTPNFTVYVDTFTVVNPDFYYIYSNGYGGQYQSNEINYNILHNKIEPVGHDLYVSTTGNNENSGLTPEEPLKTIALAISMIKADSLHPRTIHIADGIYSPNLNEQYFPLHIKAYVSIIGESMRNTILDAESSQSVFYSGDMIETGYLQRDYTIKNFKIINSSNNNVIFLYKDKNVYFENIIGTHNPTIEYAFISFLYLNANINLKNIYIYDNERGAIIYLDRIVQKSTFENVVIKDNYPSDADPELRGGLMYYLTNNGLEAEDRTLNMINCQITGNISHSGLDWPYQPVALLAMQDMRINLINATISDNHTLYDNPAINIQDGAELSIYNSILYNTEIPEIVAYNGYADWPTTLRVYNSLVEGGFTDILNIGNNTIEWDEETNLDENPYFMNSGDNPFALSRMSPCIDAGTLDLPEGVILPETDLAGNPRIVNGRVDMGAYEYQGNDANHNDELPNIGKFTNISVYPNPFRLSSSKSETTIKLEIAEEGNLKLIIYNFKGQRVKSLLNLFTVSGEYNLRWDGKDDNGKKIASGMYLIKLTQNGKTTRTKRLTIIK